MGKATRTLVGILKHDPYFLLVYVQPVMLLDMPTQIVKPSETMPATAERIHRLMGTEKWFLFQ